MITFKLLLHPADVKLTLFCHYQFVYWLQILQSVVMDILDCSGC